MFRLPFGVVSSMSATTPSSNSDSFIEVSVHGIFSAPSQEREHNGVLVQVADNDVGIPEQIKSKLFTPLATSKEESGSGLGLWVSRAIVEKHEGSIRVSSTESGYLRTTAPIFLPRKGRVRMSAGDAASGAASRAGEH